MLLIVINGNAFVINRITTTFERKKLLKSSLGSILKAELTEHLGYIKHSYIGNNHIKNNRRYS